LNLWVNSACSLRLDREQAKNGTSSQPIPSC